MLSFTSRKMVIENGIYTRRCTMYINCRIFCKFLRYIVVQYTMKQVVKEESSYEKLRREQIEANTKKLEFLGLLALAAAVKLAMDLKR